MDPRPVPPGGATILYNQDLQEVALSGGEKERCASNVSCHRERLPTPDGRQVRNPGRLSNNGSASPKAYIACALRRGLSKVAPVPKAGAGGDLSDAHPNWYTIDTSPRKTTLGYLSNWERLESGREKVPSRQRAAASLRHRIVGSRLCKSLGRGSKEARAGLIFGQATQVVLGASLRAHVSPASRQNPHPVELPAASPQPAPPSVTQEAVSSPPRIKDPPAGAV